MKPVLVGMLLYLGITSAVTAQGNEFLFARHLIERKNYDEAVYVLNEMARQPTLSWAGHDSVQFMLGKIFYNQQKLEISIQHLDSVSFRSSALKTESIFFSAYGSAYLKSYVIARQKLTNMPPLDSSLIQLRNFELAGVALLKRDIPAYDSLATSFTPANYILDEKEERFKEHHDRVLNQPKKSPAVAGVLSAIIPGAGKFYAGNRGQAIYTLLIAAVVGSQAIEGYQKDGPSSFRFIAYAAVFTSLYVGTIWGSVFTVKMKRDQLNETINHQILIDMHIPLRTVFH